MGFGGLYQKNVFTALWLEKMWLTEFANQQTEFVYNYDSDEYIFLTYISPQSWYTCGPISLQSTYNQPHQFSKRLINREVTWSQPKTTSNFVQWHWQKGDIAAVTMRSMSSSVVCWKHGVCFKSWCDYRRVKVLQRPS